MAPSADHNMRDAPSADRSWCVALASDVAMRATELRLGGKGKSLQRLLHLGVPVPQAFCVPADVFADVVERCGAAEALRDALSPLEGVTLADHTSEVIWREVSAAAIGVVMGLSLPRELCEAVNAARSTIAGPVIVRSSAVGEDGDDASFAGQLDSFAEVGSEDALVDAIKACWASSMSARSLQYQRARARPLHGVAVVVQRYVRARLSGVVFTRSPVTLGKSLASASVDGDVIYGEFCVGAGEGLVSGRKTPGSFSAPRGGDGAVVVHALPDEDDDSDNEGVDVGFDEARAAARAVCDMAREIEGAFGAPQDIEWCIDADGALWIVQARPITTPTTTMSSPDSGPGQSPPQRFSNANVNENFPEPLSPLLYSIVQKGYRAYFAALGQVMGLDEERLLAAAPALSAIVGAHGARLYYNLSSLHGCLQVAPFGEWLTSSFNVFVGVDGGAAESSRFREQSSIATEAVAGLRFLAHASVALAMAGRRLARFEDDVDAFARAAHPTLVPHLSDSDLVALVRRFLWIRCERWSPAAMGDVSAMIGYGLVRSWLKRRHKDAAETLENELLKGLSDVVSGVPTQRLWELAQEKKHGHPQFQMHLALFLETWGFRRSGELTLTAPTFQDNPAPVLALLNQFAADDGADARSPAARTAVHAAEREAATIQILRETPTLLRPVLRGLLAFTRNGIALRERARLKQALLYTRLGPVVRELGRRLQRDGVIDRDADVFMFTVDELIDQCSGSAMFGAFARDLCAQRRQQHEQLTTMQPEESFSLAQGRYLAPEPPPSSTPAPSSSSESRTLIQGAPAAAGRVTGQAAVLKDVNEAARMRRGDILVTRQTDPGWGPVLFLAGALVIERGGMLSHGAIIAREFGVPCVVGVKGASARIAHGSLIDVDGDAGTVHIREAT